MRRPVPLRIVGGPFLPEAAWQALQQVAVRDAGVQLVRHVPDMVAEMRAARASISQCGYNTALDLVVAGVPALVVPYERAGENEQSGRAARLAALGAVQHLPDGAADPSRLAAAIEDLLDFAPRPAALNLEGAGRSAELLERLQQACDGADRARRVA
jgi:predicted glycosyltransferase